MADATANSAMRNARKDEVSLYFNIFVFFVSCFFLFTIIWLTSLLFCEITVKVLFFNVNVWLLLLDKFRTDLCEGVDEVISFRIRLV